MVHLPDDIWFNIAGHLEPKFVEGLYSLNPMFLEMALNCKYRHVVINIDQLRLRYLQRLR